MDYGWACETDGGTAMNGPLDPPLGEPATAGDPAAPKKKKKDKVRSAWISFIGRIVAQIVGAVASIALAIMFLQKAQSSPEPQNPAPGHAAAVTAGRAVALPKDGRIALAVLPLSNYSGNAQQDYFADGMTEALIADLAQIEGLRVISRTSVMRYRDAAKSLREIALELGVDVVVEGSVARVGDRVRVTAQLIDAATDDHLWARTYDRTLRDVLSLQGQVAGEIAKEVKVAITPFQQGRLTRRQAIDPVAYDLYLRGRHAWNLRSQDALEAAAVYFRQAIAKDPVFALAHAGLADVYVLTASAAAAGKPAEGRAQALAAATRALELDEGLAEAHASRGAIYFFHERRRDLAERQFRRALELNAGYPTAQQWYAILLAELGREAEALTHAREAVALDPLSGIMHQALGLVHYYGRRYPDAIAELGQALELSPQLPLARSMLAKALFQNAEYAAVIRLGEAAAVPRSADLLAITGLAYLRAGDRSRSERILADLQARQPTPFVPLAYWYAATGDAEAALSMLKRHTDPSVVPAPVAVDPLFDNLRRDPRFEAVTSTSG